MYFLKGPGLNGQIQHFLETMNCFAGTSEQNGHMKETSKLQLIATFSGK
jgi:hypothetical protein